MCLGFTSHVHRILGFGFSHSQPKHSQHTFIELSAKMLPNGRWVMPLLAAYCPVWVGEAVHLADGSLQRSAGRRVGLVPPTFRGGLPQKKPPGAVLYHPLPCQDVAGYRFGSRTKWFSSTHCRAGTCRDRRDFMLGVRRQPLVRKGSAGKRHECLRNYCIPK